jgi:hypothetical protein
MIAEAEQKGVITPGKVRGVDTTLLRFEWNCNMHLLYTQHYLMAFAIWTL